MRKIISLTALLSFAITVLTSIVLYIVPQGRVAYWADWRLWNLSKEQWVAIHINIGFLFILTLLLHIYYNWKPIVLYLKNKSKQIIIFTKEFNVALFLIFIFAIGTYIEIPPFSTIIKVSNNFQESAAKKYGEPPYGHAELSSIKKFANKMNIDLKLGINLLQKAGYRINNERQTLKEIAKDNNVSPQQIYLVMSPAANKSSVFARDSQILPENPAPGTGNLTLADFCHQYNLNINMIIRSLKDINIASNADMTIKTVGETNNMSPTDVYQHIKTIVNNKIEH